MQKKEREMLFTVASYTTYSHYILLTVKLRSSRTYYSLFCVLLDKQTRNAITVVQTNKTFALSSCGFVCFLIKGISCHRSCLNI